MYTGSTEAKIYLDFVDYSEDLYLTYPSNERINIKTYDEWGIEEYKGNLKEEGTYYLELVCKSFIAELGGSFSSVIYDGILDIIDLSKKIYSNDVSYYSTNNYPGMIQYKVSGLTEDKYVFFISPDYHSDFGLYPYYPGDPELSPEYRTIDLQNLTVFEVYNVNTNETNKSLRFFKFKSGTEYIIKIHCFANYYESEKKFERYWSPAHLFFPITNQNFITLNGEENVITSEGPLLAIINPNNINKDFFYQ